MFVKRDPATAANLSLRMNPPSSGSLKPLTRQFADVEGWQTAIPEWIVRSRQQPKAWLATHKPRCLDKCKECAEQDMIKAVRALAIAQSRTKDRAIIN